MQFLAAKLSLAPDPPRVQGIKPASQPSPLLTQPAKQDRDDARSLTRALGLKVSRVVLDPGHGGDDTGASSRSGLMEKELVLDVARRLGRSEEHTSELQSHSDLVCRLLLEKKKIKSMIVSSKECL